MKDKSLCQLCGHPLIGETYACDVCKKQFCPKCQRFLSLAHIGNMNVGYVCPTCLNGDEKLMVIDPNNPRYFAQRPNQERK